MNVDERYAACGDTPQGDGISEPAGPDKWRLRFHIMPPAGLASMTRTDFVFTGGKYHFFFQYSPFDPEGGLKVWGRIYRHRSGALAV